MRNKPKALSRDEAERKIKQILAQGIVELSYHCLKQSMTLRDVEMEDIVAVLGNGQIIREPEWEERYQNWKYRVEGLDISNDVLTAITVIFEAQMSLYIVTVY